MVYEQDYRYYMYPHKNCDCCDHSTPVITPSSKETEIKSPEDTTCNLIMKVNLGTKPCLFVIYYGKYFLVPRQISNYNSLPLRKETLFRSDLIFDETGKVYKNVQNSAQYIQNYVDNFGIKSLLAVTCDRTEFDLEDTYPLFNQHRSAVISYTVFQENIKEFNQTNEGAR